MKISCCACICKNVHVNGHIVPKYIHSNITPFRKPSLGIRKSLYSIDTQSIDVHDLKRIKDSILNESCFYLKCMTCGTTFMFFSTNKKIFLEKIEPVNGMAKQVQKSDKINDHKNLQLNQYQPFTKEKDLTKINFFDDTDFEFMFSNNIEPIIGSYKDQSSFNYHLEAV